jgi:protoporphyrinogen oxidase
MDGMQQRAAQGSVTIHTDTVAERLLVEAGCVSDIVVAGERIPIDGVVSTLPLTALARLVGAPADVQQALTCLPTRGVILTYLLVDGPVEFADQWRYLGDARYRVGRVTNFSGWLLPSRSRPSRTILAAEIWARRDDPVWADSAEDIQATVCRELATSGLLSTPPADARVLRIPSAMPVQTLAAERALGRARVWLEGFDGLRSTGRFGAFRGTGVHESILLGMDAASSLIDAS